MRIPLVALLFLAVVACSSSSVEQRSDNVVDDGSQAVFERAARGVVACYEMLEGEMPRSFDETGACEHLSIWEMHSHNQGFGADAANGIVKLTTSERQSCQMRIRVDATDEDVLVDVDAVDCEDPDGYSQLGIFDGAAYGIVACHERTGGERVPMWYDETGECDGVFEWSIFLRESQNTTISTSSELVDSEEYGSTFFYRYHGFVRFTDAAGRACSFALEVEQGDEDGDAEIVDDGIVCETP